MIIAREIGRLMIFVFLYFLNLIYTISNTVSSKKTSYFCKKVLHYFNVYALIDLSNNKKQKKENKKMSPETNNIETWNQPRTTEQLLGFIARREAEIFSTEA